MNLKNLNDQELNESNIQAVKTETQATTVVLHHLMETDRRKLFSKMGYKNLYEYSEKVLKYSGKQAYRRIEAMRVLRDLPELEDRLLGGTLTLTHLTEAKRVFRKKRLNRQEKLTVMDRLNNTSTRQAQKILWQISPEAIPAERVRILGDHVSFQFTRSTVFAEKLRRVQDYYAHCNLGLGDLFEKLVDNELARLKKENAVKNTTSKADLCRQVRARDQGRCVLCGSTHALQIDHVKPRALGGKDTLENLRLLCRHCNQRAAIEVYGVDKMSNYLRDKRVEYSLSAPGNHRFSYLTRVNVL